MPTTRATVEGVQEYPGLYRLRVDSGDIGVAVILNSEQLDVLRSTITGAIAEYTQLKKADMPGYWVVP